MKRALTLIFSFVIFTSIAQAQSLPTSIQGIDIKLSNENPSPGETIVIKAESYSTDLNSANIVWMINDKVVEKAVGITNIQTKAPSLGKQLNIKVTAQSTDGKIYNGSLVLGSGSVDIVLETDGYTPPFFEGKTPLVYQNGYRLIAMPHLGNSSGKEISPKDLVYQWTKDSKVMADQSGYGKQVLFWKEEIVPRQRSINLKVSTRDGSAQAEKTINITAGTPNIVFYRDDPLYGPLYNSALDTRVNLGRSGEMSVLAAPYGFNKPASGSGALSFNWLVNSIRQVALDASQSITLRAPGDAAGTSDISLEIKNNNEILQGSKSSFNVSFSKLQETATTNSLNSNGI